MAWLEMRSCQLDGSTRGSRRSHLEEHCPTELSVMMETFTSASLDRKATDRPHVAADNLKRSKCD